MRSIERIMQLSLRAQSQAESVLNQGTAAMGEFLKMAKATGAYMPILGRRMFMTLTVIAEAGRQMNKSNDQLAASLHLTTRAWEKYSTMVNLAGVSQGQMINFLQTTETLYGQFRRGQNVGLMQELKRIGVLNNINELMEDQDKILIRLAEHYANYSAKGRESEFWQKAAIRAFAGSEQLIGQNVERLKELFAITARIQKQRPPELDEQYGAFTIAIAKFKQEFKGLANVAGSIVYPALVKLIEAGANLIQFVATLLKIIAPVLTFVFSAIATLFVWVGKLAVVFGVLFKAINIALLVNFVSWVLGMVAGLVTLIAKSVIASAVFAKVGVALIFLGKLLAAATIALGGWVILIVLAVGALIALVAWLIKNNAVQDEAADKAKETAEAFGDINDELAETVSQDLLGTMLESILNFTNKAVPPMLQVLKLQKEMATGMTPVPATVGSTTPFRFGPDRGVGSREYDLEIVVHGERGYNAEVLGDNLDSSGNIIGLGR